MEKKNKINVGTIGFLIFNIICFGGLSFIFNMDLIFNILNYYIIIISGIAILILFFNNKECFKWDKLNKIPLFLSIITLLWFFLTAIFGITFGITTIKGFINFAELLILLNVIVNIELTIEEKNIINTIILTSFFITIVLGIFQYFSGINLITYSNYVYPGILGRISSTFSIATIYDKFIVIVIPVIFYNLLVGKNKYINNILILLSGVGICLTFSRSGVIIYFTILIIYLLLLLFKKKFFSVFTIILTVFFMLSIPGTTYMLQSVVNYFYDVVKIPEKYQINLLYLNDIFEHHLYNATSSKEETKEKDDIKETEEGDKEEEISSKVKEENEKLKNDGKLSGQYRDKYKKVGKEFVKEYPIFGIGVGNYSYLYNNQNFKDYLKNDDIVENIKIMYPHNGYVQLIAETGYIGGILFIITLISFISNIFKDKKYKWELFTAIVILYGLILSGYIETIFHNKQFIYTALIIYVLMCTKAKEIKTSKGENKKQINCNSIRKK